MANKQIKLNQLGGFPFDQQTLEFMQESYSNIAAALTSFAGDDVILSGVIRAGNNISDGWIVHAGELLPFKGTASATDTFVVSELKEAVRFEDTQEKEVYFTRYAECSTVGILLNTLTRLNSLVEMQSNIVKAADFLGNGTRVAWGRFMVTFYEDNATPATVDTHTISVPDFILEVKANGFTTTAWKSFSLNFYFNSDIGVISQFGVFSSIDYIEALNGDSPPFIMSTVAYPNTNTVNIRAGVRNENDSTFRRQIAITMFFIYAPS